jgi:hypothetical protein
VQANQAAIFDVASQSGSQLAMGDVINLASVEQINFAESVQTAMQFNDATIFDGSGLQDLPDEASFPPGAGHEDLMSAINADPDFSVLYVTGSYYEVNVVEQVSMLATPHGGNTQLNSAMINDFEGVAEFQVVGGDTYNVDSIEQTNYLSQADVPPPFASGDFLPGKPASAADAAAAGPSGNLLASIIPGQTHLGGQSVSQLANNQNPGSQNPGSQNSASQNSGNQNSGNQHVGHQPVGNQHMGNQQFGANAVSDNLMGDIMAV